MKDEYKKVLRLPTIFLFLIFCFLALVCLAGDWSEDIQLTDVAQEISYVRVGSDSRSSVHLVWRQKDEDIFNIWYACVDSFGYTVVAPKQLTDTPGWSCAPDIVVDSQDNVHILWREAGPSGLDVWYTKLDTVGKFIIAPKMIVDAMGTNFDWLWPALGVDNKDNVHLVWDQSGNNTEIHYTKLDDEGSILVEDVHLNWEGNDGRSAALAVDSWGNVHVTWADARGHPASYELVYCKLDNDGNFLIDPISLTPEPDGKDSQSPDVEVDSKGYVHICYIDNQDPGWDVWYIKLDNRGTMLAEPINLDPTSSSACCPEFSIDCWDTLHLMWCDFNSLGLKGIVEYAKMAPDGSVVDTITLVPDPSADAGDVTTSTNGNVSIGWTDLRQGYQNQCIYFKYYDADCGCPDVSVYLTPDEATVPRGGRLGFDILVRNNTGSSQTFQAWTDVILPNGKPYKGNPVLGPKTVPLLPRKWVIRHITQQVPGNAPLGDYVYVGKVGTWPDSLIDQDQFDFTVVEAARTRTESSGIAKSMKDWAIIAGDDW
jgi:hypothetical protein